MINRLQADWRSEPLLWRVPMWAVIGAVTVLATHGVLERVATGVAMGGGALALQFVNQPHPAIRCVAVLGTTVGGIAACLLAPAGLGEILVLVGATRATNAFDGTALRWFVALDTIAFAVTVAVISQSIAGLLAGVGVPLLVQRSIEQRTLVREHDRATALLAEVQRGRESEAQAAALQERGRIAREMHDVLAHSLAGLSVQLQALRAVAAREQASPAVLEPLERAATLAREGLAEARAAVSTLRDPAGLGIAELPALVQRHPGVANLAVEGVAGSVDPQAGHAIYRAVQESLTNAARYAPGSPVDVTVRWAADLLTVTVRDTGPGPDRTPVAGQGTELGTGLGLAGMDERVRQAAGRLRAGPSGNGGWQVEVTMPARVGAGSPSEIAR